jgi:hypothetical protein
MVFYQYFLNIYSRIWVKSGVRDMHIIVLSTCDFREFPYRKGRMTLNKITFTRVP